MWLDRTKKLSFVDPRVDLRNVVPAKRCESSPGCLLNTGSFVCRKLLVEFQVEFKHIDARFAKNS